jgi:hypothetical protein
MNIKMLRKPPVGTTISDRLKITLLGNHTLQQKTCMIREAKYYLEHEQNIEFAGPTDVYISLIDQYGHPLTHFFNGSDIAGWNMFIEQPYPCAADEYDKPHRPFIPSPH